MREVGNEYTHFTFVGISYSSSYATPHHTPLLETIQDHYPRSLSKITKITVEPGMINNNHLWEHYQEIKVSSTITPSPKPSDFLYY